MIEVRLFATFRENREKIIFLDYYQGIRGKDIVKSLEILEEDVAIYLINGFHSKLDKELQDNDLLSLFPPVGGG